MKGLVFRGRRLSLTIVDRYKFQARHRHPNCRRRRRRVLATPPPLNCLCQATTTSVSPTSHFARRTLVVVIVDPALRSNGTKPMWDTLI